jgi:hypothetical protein
MVYFQTKNPDLGKFFRASHGLEIVDILYGHWEYFKDIWGIYDYLVHFSGFGIMHQEKSGNPGCDDRWPLTNEMDEKKSFQSIFFRPVSSPQKPGLPDFSACNIPKREKYTKRGKLYQNGKNIPKRESYTKIGKNKSKREKYIKTGENIPKRGEIYQMTTKFTKWPQNTPNDHNIYHCFPFQGPLKCTRIGIFGIQLFHLATLLPPSVCRHGYVFRKVFVTMRSWPH